MVASQAAPAPPPGSLAPPQERVPEPPGTFPKLESLALDELQRLQATTIVMDDFILDLPQAKAITTKLKEVREKNCGLAADILGREEEHERAAERLEQGRVALKQRLEVVEALTRERDQILMQRSPETMSSVLVAKAQQADHEAEDVLREALSSHGTMDASALAKFRQRFVQQKMEKHWRLAMKESLEQGGTARTLA